jgi:thiamine-monophosphate kinase
MSKRISTLADLGESGLIERIVRRMGTAVSRDWALGIGDDAAILRTRRDEELVFSTDAQVEGVHFRFGRETPRTVGRCALAVSLSDLAAMGAEPVGVLLNLAAPASTPIRIFDQIIAGFVDEAKRFDCPLVGGNLSRADAVSLDMTVIGRCRRGRALRRRGMKKGDGLYVTGVLGVGSLARLRADRTGTRMTHVPTPRIEAGRALARDPRTRACIDLSDGLATDLRHLLESDGLGAEVDPERLPRARGFDRACRQLGLDPLRILTEGGEDYELLFAFRSQRNRDAAGELSKRLGLGVHRIGRVDDPGDVRGFPAAASEHHF